MDVSRRSVLTLYRSLLREGGKFQNYNFRQYTLRKIRDSFHQRKHETDTTKITEFIACAEEGLELVRRQVAIGKLYSDEPIAVERR